MSGQIDESNIKRNVNGFVESYKMKQKLSPELDKLFDKASEMINNAKRPLIYAGGGVVSSGADSELLSFAEKINAPVANTLMGITGFPTRHPLCLGMLGMHGTAYANLAVTKCDLLIALGARFDDRVTGKIDQFAPDAKIIHIDIDPAELVKMWIQTLQ